MNDHEFETKLNDMIGPELLVIKSDEFESSWEAIEREVRRKKKIKTQVITGIAATITLLLGFSLFYFQPLEIKSGTDEQLTRTLSDGTTVSLNRNSTLTIAAGYNKSMRKVSLEGEGFFHVAEIKAKPFRVETTAGSIEVRGTSFLVKAVEEATLVSVRSGQVLVKTEDQGMTLEKGQKVALTQGKIEKRAWSSNDFAWFSRELVLDNHSLQDLSKIMEELFLVKVEVSPALRSCRISGKIKFDSREELQELISGFFPVTWKKRGDTLFMAGDGC